LQAGNEEWTLETKRMNKSWQKKGRKEEEKKEIEKADMTLLITIEVFNLELELLELLISKTCTLQIKYFK
jgi:hypothetical protein